VLVYCVLDVYRYPLEWYWYDGVLLCCYAAVGMLLCRYVVCGMLVCLEGEGEGAASFQEEPVVRFCNTSIYLEGFIVIISV
jgi:hypothetical protein